MEHKILQELGLTKGEIKVYTSLFELGETTAGPISKKSDVTHGKVYPILDKLISKGLASHSIKNGRKHFSATNPNSLLELVDKQVRRLSEEKENIKKLVTRLKAKSKDFENTPYCRVFEGIKGLRSLFQELFENNEEPIEICVFGINDLFEKEWFASFANFYHTLRHEKKIKLKLILNPTEANHTEIKEMKKNKMIKERDAVKFVKTSFPLGVFIFKDHVINLVSDNITTFDMKSKQASERFKEFFYSIWNQNLAKPKT